MYTGRHRRKSHGGLPQGSTINAGASLHFYYQWNNGEAVGEWPDSSQNNNPALQSSTDNQPAAVVGGGLDFEDSDDAANASMMDFTSITVPGANDFIMFIFKLCFFLLILLIQKNMILLIKRNHHNTFDYLLQMTIHSHHIQQEKNPLYVIYQNHIQLDQIIQLLFVKFGFQFVTI